MGRLHPERKAGTSDAAHNQQGAAWCHPRSIHGIGQHPELPQPRWAVHSSAWRLTRHISASPASGCTHCSVNPIYGVQHERRNRFTEYDRIATLRLLLVRHHKDGSTFIACRDEDDGLWYMPALGHAIDNILDHATLLGAVPRFVVGGARIRPVTPCPSKRPSPNFRPSAPRSGSAPTASTPL